MKKPIQFIIVLVVALISVSSSQAQTSIFTYQGKLNDAAAAATGTYQMQFALFPAASTGSQIGSTLTFDGSSLPAVQVTNGIFTVQLDFGSSPFTSGADRFLEISVKHAADILGYTTLAPRQQLTSSPYSIRTLAAGTADSLSANCVGCVTNSQINGVDGSKVTGTVANAGNATNAINATTATNATTANSATNFSGNLAGDVTGTQSSTVVASVGGQPSTNVAGGAQAANNATSTNTANTIVKRDASGNFTAGTVTANLSGNATTATTAANATTATTATNFSGSLAGDVGGTQGATAIQPNAVTATKIASSQVVKSLNGLKDSLTISGAGTTSVSTSGSTVTITGGGLTGVTAGNGSHGRRHLWQSYALGELRRRRHGHNGFPLRSRPHWSVLDLLRRKLRNPAPFHERYGR